jgi:hypothetical protein
MGRGIHVSLARRRSLSNQDVFSPSADLRLSTTHVNYHCFGNSHIISKFQAASCPRG